MSLRFDHTALLDMLTYCRPAGSGAESAFRDKYVYSLPGAEMDAFGNVHVYVDDSPILWSCHTDTVHHRSGRQTVHYDTRQDMVCVSKCSRRSSSCLGADDTAGVALCRQMALAGVPGHYVFHYGEEMGGRGSSDLAEQFPALVSSSQFAIALDRRGTSDVITHQLGRCASDAFAESLAAELNRHGLQYRPSSLGIFTDTANYTSVIGECTNLSVGYHGEHTSHETLDIGFLRRLFIALCKLDTDALVSARTPKDEDDWRTWRRSGWSMQDGSTSVPLDVFPVCQYCGTERTQTMSKRTTRRRGPA